MVADVDIIFEHAIIILIAFELDHLRTLGHKLLKRTKLQTSELGRCDGHYIFKIIGMAQNAEPETALLHTTPCLREARERGRREIQPHISAESAGPAQPRCSPRR